MRVVNIDMSLPLSRSCAGNILALSPNRVGPEQAEAQAAGHRPEAGSGERLLTRSMVNSPAQPFPDELA